MEAIILAGGLGTRLRKMVPDVPKSMALINGKPFLEYQLNYLKSIGIDKVVLSIGYKGSIIQECFKNCFNDIEISYAVEKKPLGTGGGIKNALAMVNSEEVLILNGDTMFNIGFDELVKFHHDAKSDLTITLRYVTNVNRYGSVEIDDDFRIVDFVEKNLKEGIGLINGGIYLINRKFFLSLPLPAAFSLEKDCFEKIYLTHDLYGFPCEGYFLDIGIPEDYQKAQDEFKRFEN